MKGKGQFMKELTEKNIKELVQTRKTLKKDLYDMKMKNAVKGLKETHKIGAVKSQIARVQTVLASKVKKGQ